MSQARISHNHRRFARWSVTPQLMGRAVDPLDRAGSIHYLGGVSPTVFRARGYRFYFFSREEPRLHIHVQHANGEAKFWIEPAIELAHNYGLRPEELGPAEELIREHEDEIRAAWRKHFGD